MIRKSFKFTRSSVCPKLYRICGTLFFPCTLRGSVGPCYAHCSAGWAPSRDAGAEAGAGAGVRTEVRTGAPTFIAHFHYFIESG